VINPETHTLTTLGLLLLYVAGFLISFLSTSILLPMERRSDILEWTRETRGITVFVISLLWPIPLLIFMIVKGFDSGIRLVDFSSERLYILAHRKRKGDWL